MRKFLIIVSVLGFLSASAQDITKGTWYNEEKTSRIQFYEIGDKFYGKIVWLKDPLENGKPRTDNLNPNKKQRTIPLMGLVFMKNFVKKGDKKWEDGTIYDPLNGKTYSCTITQVSTTQLDVRGYIGISLIGRTTKFTKAD